MKPHVPYYRPPDNTQVKEFDVVEIMSGEHKGVAGTVGSICPNGDMKIWPKDESYTSNGKLWIHKPDLKLLERFS